MEFGPSLSYPFSGPRWLGRAMVGAALEVVPILAALPLLLALVRRHGPPRLAHLPLLGAVVVVGLVCRWVVLGYLARVARDGLARGGAGLPAWDRFERDLVEGIKLWLLTILLFLPALAITAGLAFLLAAVGFPAPWLPILIVLPVLAIATIFLLPAALLAAVARDELGAAFDLASVTGVIGRMFGPYVVAFLLALAVEIVAQLGLLVLCAGIFVTRFLAHCIVVHAFAAVYREAGTADGPPLAV